MACIYEYKRDAIRVKVIKYEGSQGMEHRKFSVDPQITSYDVLLSLLAKAFDIKGGFTVSYRVVDDFGQETFLSLLSDWDLDAAFLRASEPYLCLRIDTKVFDKFGGIVVEEEPISLENKPPQGFHDFIMNRVEKTFNIFQRALNFVEETPNPDGPPRPPLSDSEFRHFLDPVGQLIDGSQLRSAIYYGGVDASLRKVVWKHILNVYPEGMTGRERIDYIKRKSQEYIQLRDTWRDMLKNGYVTGDLAYVSGMVRKDVLRTDRHHIFYAGSDDNKNVASLFNILTTYALNHPTVSYCQGMSDLASPLLVTMNDEAHAYICFCALMQRLSPNFLVDGITMTQRFQHLADGLQHYDSFFYNYLKSHQADDLLFCYRWLLLEMKREFAFEDALRMLEVMWSSLPPCPPINDLSLYEQQFVKSPPVSSPRPKHNAYTKVCALRRSLNHSLDETRCKNESITKIRGYSSLDDMNKKEGESLMIKNLSQFHSLKKEDKIIENSNKIGECSSVLNELDDVSPDDFVPVSDPITRSLHLDLEKLDKQVLGESDSVFFWENPLESNTEDCSSLTEGNCSPDENPTIDKNDKCINFSTNISVTSPNGQTNIPLPPPHEFGGGNPFLMFLCITILRQHRDFIISQKMDYNEMAMHFDKMVRKHNVNRVLNQARQLFSSYLKSHSWEAEQHNFSV